MCGGAGRDLMEGARGGRETVRVTDETVRMNVMVWVGRTVMMKQEGRGVL